MSVAASDNAAPAQQARIELADVFARYADGYFDTHGATQTQRKVARAIVGAISVGQESRHFAGVKCTP